MILNIPNVEYKTTLGTKILQIDSDEITSIDMEDRIRKRAHPFNYPIQGGFYEGSFSELYMYILIIKTLKEKIEICFTHHQERHDAIDYIYIEMINPIRPNSANKFYKKERE